jgi:Flp pilus assembly protein TadG
VSIARRRQRGQTLIVFALGFALFLFSLTCLVADTAYLFVWSGRVQSAAQLGAQSGADSVDPRYLYEDAGACGTPGRGLACAAQIVDISTQDRQGALYAFQRACIQTADESAQIPRDAGNPLPVKTADDPQTPDGTLCASDGCRVYAEVSRVVQLPIPLPGFPDSITVRGAGYAAPVVGTTVATSTCTGVAWVPAPPPR